MDTFLLCLGVHIEEISSDGGTFQACILLNVICLVGIKVQIIWMGISPKFFEGKSWFFNMCINVVPNLQIGEI